jgi:hypothetical protein
MNGNSLRINLVSSTDADERANKRRKGGKVCQMQIQPRNNENSRKCRERIENSKWDRIWPITRLEH